MAMAASVEASGNTRQLDQTPTWAVAAVCSVFILISIFLEKGLHVLGTVSLLMKLLSAQIQYSDLNEYQIRNKVVL